MADRTVRAIFEARVSGAQKGMRDLGTDVDKAGKKVDTLSKDLKTLDAQKVNPKIDLAIKDAQRNIKELTAKLGELRTMDASPEVTADIRQAERQLADARKALRQLDAAKATMKVTADMGAAKKDISSLADDVADAGAEGGEEAGGNIVGGILDALRTIPIAGAVIGVGVAIAGGILLGIKQGLAIEAERDLFSAQTGLDEDTAARFGRAAGESYANAWGDSVAINLDTARRALAAGIIDESATDAQIENVIAKLTGIADLFDYDIAMAVQAVGNAMKTGLVRDADQAFDLIVASSQKVAGDDLLETINEYSNQFVTLGLSGEQAFGLIVQGAEAGARDTDKVGDSLKELGLRIREGLDPARDALGNLGLDVDDTIDAFTQGGPRATTAIGKVFDALRDLEAEGGNTQEVIAALFGGPGEDLGAALYALDIDAVTEALGGVDGAAGTAERALKTMSDNSSTKIEQAKRNVEIAMDGIKGALAETFGDEISGAAEWVSKNRAPLMQFFLDVITGTIDMAGAFAEFGASALDAIADISFGMADLIESIPFVDDSIADSLRRVGGSAAEAAVAIRFEVPAALDEAKAKAETWAAPEILKAKVHDATVAMTQDIDEFAERVKAGKFTVTINGDTLTADEALAELVENINAEDGTVTINGDRVPAEDALDRVLALIEAGAEDVTIGGDIDPAQAELDRLKGRIGATKGSVTVSASTSAAERALKELTKTRYATLQVRVAGVTGQGGQVAGNYAGGWTGQVLPGRRAGGWVPGARAGYDNVLWPLYSGGQTLMQPLEGKEFVVNSKASAENAALLEFLNAGGRMPQTVSETTNAPIYIGKVEGTSLAEVEREARQRARFHNLTGGNK